jgi:hypothetical protein
MVCIPDYGLYSGLRVLLKNYFDKNFLNIHKNWNLEYRNISIGYGPQIT